MVIQLENRHYNGITNIKAVVHSHASNCSNELADLVKMIRDTGLAVGSSGADEHQIYVEVQGAWDYQESEDLKAQLSDIMRNQGYYHYYVYITMGLSEVDGNHTTWGEVTERGIHLEGFDHDDMDDEEFALIPWEQINL